MNKELIAENDRSIRLYGIETQKKLFESTTILFNLTPSITELAKDLLLSGVSLILFDDNSIINELDTEINFFFNSDDINKNKSIVLKNKLQMIKENCNIQIISIEKLNNINNVKYAAFDFFDFSKENFKKIENFIIKNQKICYYLFENGNIGYYINNLIEKKEEENKKEEIQIDLNDENENEKIEGNINLEEEKNENKTTFINLLEEYYITSLENKILKKIFEPFQLKDNILNNKLKKYVLPLSFYCLVKDENFKSKYEDLNEKVKENLDFIKNTENQFNSLYYFETCNIIGGLVCQDIIKCIGMKEKLNCNLYSFNCNEENGEFMK